MEKIIIQGIYKDSGIVFYEELKTVKENFNLRNYIINNNFNVSDDIVYIKNDATKDDLLKHFILDRITYINNTHIDNEESRARKEELQEILRYIKQEKE